MGTLVVGAACALAASCNGKSGNDAGDANTGSPYADASQDAHHADASQDAHHADATSDAGSEACTNPFNFDAALCCYTTATEGCKQDPNCLSKWPGNPLAFCPGNGYFGVQDCGGYHVVHVLRVDVGWNYYYDIQSGNLLAIENWDANAFSIFCAGPSEFTPPACSNNWSYVDCRDAGIDAAGGAGGSSSGGGIGGADAGSG